MRSDVTALAAAADQVGDRWSILLVAALLDGPRRFGELVDDVGGIAPNVLSKRLKRLEADGVVVATAYSARPPRFSYELTAAGQELAGVVRLLAAWGAQRGAGAEPLRHDGCGTAVEARWWCSTCDRVVTGETSDLTYL